MRHQFTAPPPERYSTRSTQRFHPADPEPYKAAALKILSNCDVRFGPSKVHRLCCRFVNEVRGSGWDFFDFFTTELAISAEQKRTLRDDPEVQRIFRFGLDPTGEQAVGNVMRERGY